MLYKKALGLLIPAILVLNLSFGQGKLNILTQSIRAKVVDSLSGVLSSNYIYPDTAARMISFIGKRLKTGAYDKVTDPAELAKHLTTDLHSINNDKHLNIRYNGMMQKDTQRSSYIQQAITQMQMAEQNREQNYGLAKAEILSGNIGYVEITGFFDLTDESKRAVNSAFDLLINSSVVIIDLRLNGGGQANMVHYICSMFFKDATHINDFYIHSTNQFHQNWTEPLPQSAIWNNIPVYLLTSAYTASAAEEFTYDMQSQHRATIVGEVTCGAANPMKVTDIGNGFTAWIPFARSVNPITKTNWEGTGIKPDIATKASDALDAAIQNYYQHQVHSKDTVLAKRARWMYFIYKAKLHPYKMNTHQLKKFIGKYGDLEITMENGHLIYHAFGYTTGISPISKTNFVMDAPLDKRKMIFRIDAMGRPYQMRLNFDGDLSEVYKNDRVR